MAQKVYGRMDDQPIGGATAVPVLLLGETHMLPKMQAVEAATIIKIELAFGSSREFAEQQAVFHLEQLRIARQFAAPLVA